MPKPASKLLPGRLSVHRDGYGFVILDHPMEGIQGDVFLPPDAAGKAMHGDRVAVRITRFNQRDGRAEGDIAKVIERANTAVVGKFRRRQRKFWVQPHDDRIRQWIEIPDKLAIPREGLALDRVGATARTITNPDELEGMVVTAEVIQFPAEHTDAVGRVVEVLGLPDDFGVDVEIIIRKHRIPHRFPPQVIEQARAIPASIPDSEITRRQDFRDLDIVTIDGETARDFDDAVWVEHLPNNGHFTLQVHIADVSHYVRPGSAIDQEAVFRGTSVYFPDRAVPMLPLELSTEICSLKPREDRLVVSALLEIDRRGDIVSQRFTRGIIRSVERMTYTNVHALLEGDPTQRERYAPLVSRFELMRELALILNRKRFRRGSIDFDLPEPLIEFDEFGEMVGVIKAPRNIAHRIIEEFMLAANEAVASHVAAALAPFVYRIHEVPDAKKVIEFEEIAAQFGASLGIPALTRRFRHVTRPRDGRKSARDIDVPASDFTVSSRHYQKLIEQIEGKPEERILSYLMLRSLKQARYSAENLGHFALASDCYTHFTSPIRRYPDLLVHRILCALLDGGSSQYSEQILSRLSDSSSLTERRAAEAERELVEWKKTRFMTGCVGDEFPALIISTTKYGFFVELEKYYIEGLVPLDSIPGDRYGYHENSRRIIGARTRHEFRIGDRVTARLDRVNAVERKLEFSIAMPRKGKRK